MTTHGISHLSENIAFSKGCKTLQSKNSLRMRHMPVVKVISSKMYILFIDMRPKYFIYDCTTGRREKKTIFKQHMQSSHKYQYYLKQQKSPRAAAHSWLDKSLNTVNHTALCMCVFVCLWHRNCCSCGSNTERETEPQTLPQTVALNKSQPRAARVFVFIIVCLSS